MALQEYACIMGLSGYMLHAADHRLSKLAHKTNRIVDLCVSDINQAQAEKKPSKASSPTCPIK